MKIKNNNQYNFEDSFERIQEILDSSETFDYVDNIPDSDKLTYSNGYYIKCFSIFIDIRDSSQLPKRYQKRSLAKIYRAYISEIVALFQSSVNCKEINIVGDSVWGIFLSQKKSDVLEVFQAAFSANSIINTLNYKLCKKDIESIKIGIGVVKGDALMVLAGYKGSGIKDVVYMGAVVNNANKLCSKANKNVNKEIVVSEYVYSDLEGFNGTNNVPYQDMLEYNNLENFYHGSIVKTKMDNWLKEKQKKNPCKK